MLDLEFYLIRYFINQYRHVKLHADDLDRRDPATTQTSYKNNELSFDISGVGKINLEGVRRESVISGYSKLIQAFSYFNICFMSSIISLSWQFCSLSNLFSSSFCLTISCNFSISWVKSFAELPQWF